MKASEASMTPLQMAVIDLVIKTSDNDLLDLIYKLLIHESG